MEIQKIQMFVHISILSICLLYGTNVSVSWSRISLQVVDLEQGAFWFTNKQMQVEILSMFKLVSFESLARNDVSEQGSQAEAHCNRNLNHQLWSIRHNFLESLFKEFL